MSFLPSAKKNKGVRSRKSCQDLFWEPPLAQKGEVPSCNPPKPSFASNLVLGGEDGVGLWSPAGESEQATICPHCAKRAQSLGQGLRDTVKLCCVLGLALNL